MNFLVEMHNKKLAENDNVLRFWEDYLNNLKSLDFSIYTDKLKVPVLVPIGNRILFRGDLKHTNEVMVSLGADYFAKCSIKQADILRQHRIKGAESKVQMYRKEREFLENQMFGKNNVYKDPGQEIFEVFTEEEDKIWKDKHRENVKKYKQDLKSKEKNEENIADEELWERLEELELQEELENELAKRSSHDLPKIDINETPQYKKTVVDTKIDLETTNVHSKSDNLKSNDSHLLQKILDKQSELENKLQEIKNRRIASKSESDLISRLKEMEELDELEDEMDRVDDILETEDVEEAEEDEISRQSPPVLKFRRSVSFADEDDAETLELTFQHSNIEPSNLPFEETRGITKPSDIYKAFPNNFKVTTSILKKSKCEGDTNFVLDEKINSDEEDTAEVENRTERTIVVKDIVDKKEVDQDNVPKDTTARPTSLFKMRRQQRKQ